ncbi:MAG TPA: hypothetical protein DEP18_04160 [Flavobacteriales bacterium]|nr:hypothetical protein [Flavobacteriales bacterium]HRE74616.1 hypothetical protein [Flavobacteriales bacterium]HRE98348.1 hypothetical protein [Flavobacteriales bacterium]HRJ40220.1 hypothetical protein [Flavobacteriales bacterium]
MLSPEEFKRLTIQQRFNRLQKDGDFVASRFYQSFNVHLFTLYGFYVEIWQTISLGDVAYIEVVGNDATLREYTKDIDLNKDLGIGR